VFSFFDASSLVSAAGAPPAAGTLQRLPLKFGAKTIVPSRFQLPPRPSTASQIVSAGPPEASIFFNFPLAKKPILRLSGDQNKLLAPSVPARGWAVSAPRGRTQRTVLPAGSAAMNARREESGERAMEPAVKSNCDFSGGRTEL
jgi:hypothetical protein